MSEERTRVEFDAPASLVERADSAAELLGVSRTRLLIEALEGRLADLADDEEFRREVAGAYYESDVEYEVVEDVLGTDAATKLDLLRESLDSEPPEPQLDEPPTDGAFYEGHLPRWRPDEDSDDAA